jgi:hypothetical protein
MNASFPPWLRQNYKKTTISIKVWLNKKQLAFCGDSFSSAKPLCGQKSLGQSWINFLGTFQLSHLSFLKPISITIAMTFSITTFSITIHAA